MGRNRGKGNCPLHPHLVSKAFLKWSPYVGLHPFLSSLYHPISLFCGVAIVIVNVTRPMPSPFLLLNWVVRAVSTGMGTSLLEANILHSAQHIAHSRFIGTSHHHVTPHSQLADPIPTHQEPAASTTTETARVVFRFRRL